MPRYFTSLREANKARQKEWDAKKELTLSYKANEMQSEAGEAGNVVKKLERERLGLPGSRATVLDLADELADVIICVDLLAMEFDIDLDTAVERKFNKTSVENGFETLLLLTEKRPTDGLSDDELHFLRRFHENYPAQAEVDVEEPGRFAMVSRLVAKGVLSVIPYEAFDRTTPRFVARLTDKGSNLLKELREWEAKHERT